LSAISSENVTVMRSGGGCALARRRQRQRHDQRDMARHRDRQGDAFFLREARSGGIAHRHSAYGVAAEPLVTSEIEVNPARFSSPITAITRP
jgi:hypothetical protein